MPFCPSCGAQTSPAMTFCASCGAPVVRSQYAQPAPPPPAAVYAPAPAPAARGPPGRTMEPVVVILLAFVTLGIYLLFYWWRTTKEIDAYTGRGRHAHGLARIGVPLVAAGMGALLVGYTLVLSFAFSVDPTTETPDVAAAMGSVVGGGMLVFFGAMTALAGGIVLLVSQYRLWDALETHERAAGEPSPISAGMMIGFAIVAKLVPFIGLVFLGIVLYMTQDHLNRAWQRAEAFRAPSASS